MKPGKRKSHLLGVGLDSDGEKRITRAEDFSIIGGTEETHDKMTETLVKTFEDLKRRGKTLDDANPEELGDIIKNNIPR